MLGAVDEDRAASAWYRPSRLALKIGLVLVLPFLGAVTAATLFGLFLARTDSVPAQLNFTGRQRMLAMQLGSWGALVAAGQEEERAHLRGLIATYDRTFAALTSGGTLDGQTLRPLPAELGEPLAVVAHRWQALRARVIVLAEQPSGSPPFLAAADGLAAAADELRAAADQLAFALQDRTLRLRRSIFNSFLVGVGLNLLLVVFGLWYVRRFILRPILRLDEGARRIINGDYSIRVECTTRDEICQLARTFNELAARLEKLLAALELRRRQAEALLECLPVGVAVLDDGLTVARGNRRLGEILGLEPERFAGRPLAEILPLEALPEALRAAGEGEIWRNRRWELATPEASRSLRISAAATRLAGDGGAEGEARLILAVEDLTAAEQLRDEADMRLAALDGTDDSILITNRKASIEYVNRAFCEQHGYLPEEILGSPVRILASDGTDPAVYESLQRAFEAGLPWRGEPLNQRQDGSRYPAEVTVTPVRDAGGEIRHFVCVGRDVSERRALTARMLEMDRMISFGTLAAGVAHEINNPLAFVAANLELLAERLPALADVGRARPPLDAPGAGDEIAPPPAPALVAKLVEMLDEAREGADRVRRIVRDLRTLARTEEEPAGPVDLRRVLDSAANIAGNEIRHRARLVKDYAAAPPVEGSEARLGQVFLNLLVNAAQAIPEGAADVNTVRVRMCVEADWVTVEVSDSGCGIPPVQRARLFEPFFTTKPAGHGTGLGLAICRRIVESHGGRIEVESEPGHGSTFRVFLPTAPLAMARRAEAPPADAVPSRRGRILVVDDEPLLCRLMERALADEHEVETFTRARDALARIAAGERFDLVLCDLMMPEMTGMEFHQALLESAPDQAERTIFLTGGAFSPGAGEFLARVPNQRLEKPFDLRSLRALIGGLLR